MVWPAIHYLSPKALPADNSDKRAERAKPARSGLTLL